MTATHLPVIVWSTVLLWGIYANQMAAKCHLLYTGTPAGAALTAPRTAANAPNPKEGRMSCSLSPFYRCWKGGWGDLPPRGSVRAGISGCGSQVPALCTDHASWSRSGGRFLFLSHKRENIFPLPLREFFLPASVVLICIKDNVHISWFRNPYCQLKLYIIPEGP